MKTQQYSSHPTSPALFRAQNTSGQEMFFTTSQEACNWMLTHQNWVLAKRETVKWTFPLDKIVAQLCWVKVGSTKETLEIVAE